MEARVTRVVEAGQAEGSVVEAIRVEMRAVESKSEGEMGDVLGCLTKWCWG